ncbi:hypothetical protein MRX96_007940 [Rhipicephalus microplus]
MTAACGVEAAGSSGAPVRYLIAMHAPSPWSAIYAPSTSSLAYGCLTARSVDAWVRRPPRLNGQALRYCIDKKRICRPRCEVKFDDTRSDKSDSVQSAHSN